MKNQGIFLFVTYLFTNKSLVRKGERDDTALTAETQKLSHLSDKYNIKLRARSCFVAGSVNPLNTLMTCKARKMQEQTLRTVESDFPVCCFFLASSCMTPSRAKSDHFLCTGRKHHKSALLLWLGMAMTDYCEWFNDSSLHHITWHYVVHTLHNKIHFVKMSAQKCVN